MMDEPTTSPALPLTGGCQCGAIRYEVTAKPPFVYACHCTDCQRQSASAFSLAMPTAREAFRLTKGAPKAWRRLSPSGAEVISWFCPECACRIYGERPSRPTSVNVRAGTLDDTSWIGKVAHLWHRSAQPWMHFDPDALIHETQPDDMRAFFAELASRPG